MEGQRNKRKTRKGVDHGISQVQATSSEAELKSENGSAGVPEAQQKLLRIIERFSQAQAEKGLPARRLTRRRRVNTLDSKD